MREAQKRIRWTMMTGVALVVGLLVYICIYISYDRQDGWSGFISDAAPIFCFTFLWLLAPYVLFVDWLRRMRKRRGGMVLAHVEEAVRLNLPLSTMMLAAAHSETGVGRWRLLDLHDKLERGRPLGEALHESVPELPAATTRAITAAAEIGSLPQELRRLVGRYTPEDRYLDRFYRWYAVLTAVILLTVVCGFLSIIVIPKFISITHAMGAPMPRSTQILIAVANSYIPFVVVGIVLLLVCIPWSGALRDYLIGMVPVVGSAARDQAMAEFCAFLTNAIEAGQPLDAALRQAARAQPNAIVRKRVNRWADRVARGESMADAANASRMPSLLTGMLKSAGGSEGIVQAMSFLARHYEYRFSRLREFLRAAAIPAFVVVMGGLVLCVELAVFQPMLSLIEVASHVGRHTGAF